MRIFISLLIFTVILAAEEAREPTKMAPADSNRATIKYTDIDSLRAEISRLKARNAWCSQELNLWQNIPVMEVRLELAREEAKAAERDKAAKSEEKR